MATYTLQPDGTAGIDNNIISDIPTTNRGTNTGIDIGYDTGGSGKGRGLIKFDFSSIPTNLNITSSIMTITPVIDYSSNSRTLSVYRSLRAWTESGSTWNKYDGTNNWGTAGADNTTTDREATAIGTVSVGASPTIGAGIDIPLNAAAIQEMVRGTFANNGFVLRVNTESDDGIVYASSDNATPSYRPKLVIEGTLPGGGHIYWFD